ncbi:hypothetical protein [Armatimonas sp.]|uniref:hypothetical protein n=1 Tax=Armatimonas sp. TaxID=1872638 RepID=UPI00286A473D|nr:hypothetical protein [Armatimonas sp.]
MLAPFLCLLLTLTEPISYKIALTDGTKTTAKLTLSASPEGPVRVESDDTISTFRPYAVSGTTATVVGKLSRWEALPVRGGWKLQKPLGGVIPLDAPLLTFHDLRLFLGKRIAEREAAGKPLRFWQLGYTRERPALDLVELTADGAIPMQVGGKRVIAKRYQAKVTLGLTQKVERSTIHLGPSGELINASPPFVSSDLRAQTILAEAPSGGLVITYRLPGYTLRAEPFEGGYQVKVLVDDKAVPGSITTDLTGKPLRIENEFPGKPFVGLVESGSLNWSMDTPQIARTVLPDPDDIVLFPAQLFATSVWEKRFTTVGELHEAVLLLMHDGLPDEVTIERVADPAEGLHRYRFTSESFKADLITDGTRLRLLRRPEGSQVVSGDGEALGAAYPTLAWL